MIVPGALRTVTYQAFDVNVLDLPDGGKAMVAVVPPGEAHVFMLTDEAREKVHDATGSPIKVVGADQMPSGDGRRS